MNKKLFGVIIASAAFVHPHASSADVIREQLIRGDKAASIALGQSLITPAGGPWNNLTFNWFDFDTGGTSIPGILNPIAAGTLFLLNQEYLGTPSALSAATGGYIGQSQSIANGIYIFDPDVILQPNTTYFFFTNQSVPNNSGGGNFSLGSAYGDVGSGGTYIALPEGMDARFRLQGNMVPEPSALALWLLAFLLGFVARWSRALGIR
jgi:hypothetical protein